LRRTPLNQRLPLALSIAALVTALLGATPVGEAAADAVAQVVPRARTADFATNAGKLQGRRSSTAPKAGQIPVLNSRGKLPASIGAVGPRGAAGPPGASEYEQRTEQVSAAPNQSREYGLSCSGGKSVLSGGYNLTAQGGNLRVFESRPAARNLWRFRIDNATGAQTAIQLFVVCANVSG
jgi:hypothetical protein